jgi:hypothetical protein
MKKGPQSDETNVCAASRLARERGTRLRPEPRDGTRSTNEPCGYPCPCRRRERRQCDQSARFPPRLPTRCGRMAPSLAGLRSHSLRPTGAPLRAATTTLPATSSPGAPLLFCLPALRVRIPSGVAAFHRMHAQSRLLSPPLAVTRRWHLSGGRKKMASTTRATSAEGSRSRLRGPSIGAIRPPHPGTRCVPCDPCAALAQLVRAPDCGSGGPPFEPGRRYQPRISA